MKCEQVGWVEPTGPARSGRPDDRLRETHHAARRPVECGWRAGAVLAISLRGVGAKRDPRDSESTALRAFANHTLTNVKHLVIYWL